MTSAHRHDGGQESHDHTAELRNTSRRSLFVALALISCFMVAEAVGGLLSGSLALLADAGHMMTDWDGCYSRSHRSLRVVRDMACFRLCCQGVCCLP